MREGSDGEEGERSGKEGKRNVGEKKREIRSPDRSCSVVNSTCLSVATMYIRLLFKTTVFIHSTNTIAMLSYPRTKQDGLV